MLYYHPWRVLLRNTNTRFQIGQTLLKWNTNELRGTKVGSMKHDSSSISAYKLSNPKLFGRCNFISFSESRRGSQHLIRSEELPENGGDGKIIPITIIARFLDKNQEINNKEQKMKVKSPLATESKTAETVKEAKETANKEVEVENDITGNSLVSFSKNISMRDEWTRRKPQRPKTSLENICFKETYEKLKKLGILKARPGNCCVGMTSPSGKYKFETQTVPGKKENSLKTSKKPSHKLPEIKSQFLLNNVVVKVQHFYHSQGKEMPEELKILADGSRSIHRRCESEKALYRAKLRRATLYPCTSPSQSHFTRNSKNSIK